MRYEDGHWVCTWCGAALEIPIDKRLVETERGTGDAANRRIITVEGRAVHECALLHVHDEDRAVDASLLEQG